MIDGWLVIPGWPKWQSRRDRHDPWVKDYIDQLDRDEYLSLTLAERGLIVDIRRTYARCNGQLRAKMLPGYIHARVRINQLERLVDAGLLIISAAKPPPISSGSAARAGEEEEREEERESKGLLDPNYAAPVDNGDPDQDIDWQPLGPTSISAALRQKGTAPT